MIVDLLITAEYFFVCPRHLAEEVANLTVLVG